MARTKGYRSYRGRGTRKKILLAVLLCLVILAVYLIHGAGRDREEAEEDEP